ncbi:hypothetical protein KKG72_00295 [bacterium]|nr:hypothetical protein [bacterium]MBU1993284.1 hypothetical protein [bacterium]
MNKYIFVLALLFVSLELNASEDYLESIYVEASLFAAVIIFMSVISYVISSRHAKEYTKNNQAKMDDALLKNKESVDNEKKRVEVLSKMLEDGLLEEDEFKLLKKWKYNKH